MVLSFGAGGPSPPAEKTCRPTRTRLRARHVQSLLSGMAFDSGHQGDGARADAVKPDVKLVLVPDLSLTMRDGRLRLDTERGGEAARGWHVDTLQLLSAFRHPTLLSEALDTLGGSASEKRQQATRLLELVDAGVLIQVDGHPLLPFALNDEESWLHIAMLSDEHRTCAYLDAVRKVVQPGDVVLDLGTGTGILAVAAAQAGARHVYAIEKGAIADYAARVFVDNGVADRVTLIRELSTRVELPERANVLVTETFGDEPLSEQVLAYVGDAVQRLLTPDARILPSQLRILGCPLELSEEFLDNHVFDPQATYDWTQLYDIDLGSLENASQSIACHHSQHPDEILCHTPLSEPFELCRIDLCSPPSRLDVARTVRVTQDGRLDAALVFFELTLSDEHVLDNDPAHPRAATHWRIPLWLQPERPTVSVGDELRLRYVFEDGRARVDATRCG